MRLFLLLLSAFWACVCAVGAEGPASIETHARESVSAISPAEPATVASVRHPAASEIGAFQTAEDGTRYLTLRFRSPGAFATRLHLTAVHLPAGAKLYAYGVNNGAVTDVVGPYRGAGADIDSSLWTAPVHGSDIVLELQEGVEPIADLPFQVSEIAAVASSEFDTQAAAPADIEVRTSLFRGIPVTHEIRNGLAMFEGDIVLGQADELPAARSGKGSSRSAVAITGSNYRWPGGTMPYAIDPTMPNTTRITDAIAHWNTVMAGVVKLVPRTTESAYLYFYRSPSAGQCASSVGRLGYNQYLYVGDYCSTGNMIHEIGHAFGLWHEQSREDRNSHVIVNFANIDPNASFNFNQNIYDGDDIGAYDYGSVMHYNAYAFSINGLPTIETIPAGIPIGQRSALSAGDIAGIKALYPASSSGSTSTAPTTVAVTVTSNPAGMPLVVDGTTYTASKVFNWTPGSSHVVSALNPASTATSRSVFQKWSDNGGAFHLYTAPASTAALTATYAVGYSVTATASGNGTAVVAPASADSFYPALSSVAVQATPGAGSCFTGWTGLIAGTPATATVSVTQAYQLAANFQTGAVSINPASLLASGNGGSYYVGLTATSGCAWTFQSPVSWVRLRSTAPGNGSAALSINIDPNNTGLIRNAIVSIGPASLLVWQGPKR